jgi:hypothetical protein
MNEGSDQGRLIGGAALFWQRGAGIGRVWVGHQSGACACRFFIIIPGII